MHQILVRHVTSPEDLEKVFSIRREVFVLEQKCPPELEWEHEEESNHFLACLNDVPAGAARWRQTDKGYKLERFAVLKEFRGKGVGGALVKAVLESVPQSSSEVYLHAQITAVGLYEKYGFQAEHQPFVEAGIIHYKMRKV